MLQLLLRFPTGIISRYVLHRFPVFPSWFELWLPTVVICLTAPPLSASFSCLSHLLVSSPVFPGITSQGNNLYSNPCLSITSVQSLSRVWLFAIPWTAAHQASLSITNSRSLLKVMSIESVMPSNHFISLISSSSHTFHGNQAKNTLQAASAAGLSHKKGARTKGILWAIRPTCFSNASTKLCLKY